MAILNTTSRERETYQVHIKYSLLWECALGIAAITNSRLIDTLEKPEDFWKKVRAGLSKGLLESLDYVEKNNTWKSLLLLLHQQEFLNLTSFVDYINNLSDQEFRYICLPFIGTIHQETRYKASNRNTSAKIKLKEATKNNPFFPSYIEFICESPTLELKKHLIEVMSNWYHEFIEPEGPQVLKYLEREVAIKQKMMEKMGPEEFVEWATGGVSYLPEPSVHHVLLIPQYIYRPWNIEADIEDTKVFYYPISNESIYPEDPYAPNYFLVHKHKALGDEVRLRIVKFLFNGDRTLQEITNQLGMGKTTLHHHLKILRSARLVGVENAKYSLKKNGLSSLAKELDQYLN